MSVKVIYNVNVYAFIMHCLPLSQLLVVLHSFSMPMFSNEMGNTPKQGRQNVKRITRRRIITIIIIKSILKGPAFLCCIDSFVHICPAASKRLQFYCWTISIEPTVVIFQPFNRLEVLIWFINLWRLMPLKKWGFNDLETYGGRKTSSEMNTNGFISLCRLLLLFEMICQQTEPIIRVKQKWVMHFALDGLFYKRAGEMSKCFVCQMLCISAYL